VDDAMTIDSLLARLPDAQREVLVLRFWHDLPEAEIGEIVGCPTGTVKSRIHNGLARLAKLAGEGNAMSDDAAMCPRSCERTPSSATTAPRSHCRWTDWRACSIPSSRLSQPPALSLRVLAAGSAVARVNAANAYRRRLIAGVALSIAPFPLLVFFNLYLLRAAYELLIEWLPVAFVAWVVIGYAAALLLICALTYASLPVLIARARARAVMPLESGAYA
jgi:hypothetical protein